MVFNCLRSRGDGVLLASVLRTQAVPQIEEGAVTETQTKGSDLTKWAVNDHA